MPQAASAMDSLQTLHRATWLQLAAAGAEVRVCMAIKNCNRGTAKKQLANAQAILAIPVKGRLNWHLKKTVADDLHVPLMHVKDASECAPSLCTGAGLETLFNTSLPNLSNVEYYGVNAALDYSKAA